MQPLATLEHSAGLILSSRLSPEVQPTEKKRFRRKINYISKIKVNFSKKNLLRRRKTQQRQKISCWIFTVAARSDKLKNEAYLYKAKSKHIMPLFKQLFSKKLISFSIWNAIVLNKSKKYKKQHNFIVSIVLCLHCSSATINDCFF